MDVGAQLFVASTGDGVPWAKVTGMSLGSGRLIYATPEGKLWRVNFTGKPTGTVTQIGGGRIDGTNWASTGLFAHP